MTLAAGTQTMAQESMPAFDIARAMLRGPDMFPRLRIEGDGSPLSSLQLSPKTKLFIVERSHQRLAFPYDEMVYWDIAQGELSDKPYALTFCASYYATIRRPPWLQSCIPATVSTRFSSSRAGTRFQPLSLTVISIPNIERQL